MGRLLLTAMLALLGSGCTDLVIEPTIPEAKGLGLSLEASTRQISPGDTLRLVARLKNTNAHGVTLNFSSGCQILLYIEDAAGAVIEPQGGAWGCYQALTSIQIDAGQTETRIFTWTGQHMRYDPATWQPIRDPLPPGQYRAHVILVDSELDGRRISLRTPALPLEIR
jgi:hypothetical protein